MKEKVLIVEDQFVEADYLRLMLTKAGYGVTGIARSVSEAQKMIEFERPDFVLLDIFLKGKLTGIDLAKQLAEDNIPFVYLSANSNEEVLNAAKATQPYGFLVKPFREKDLLVTLEIARYRHEHSQEAISRRETKLQKQLSGIITETIPWEQKLLKLARAFQPYISFDYFAAGFNAIGKNSCYALSFLRIGYDEYQQIGVNELLTITGLSMEKLLSLADATQRETVAGFYNDEGFETICREPSLKKLFANTFKLKSHLFFP